MSIYEITELPTRESEAHIEMRPSTYADLNTWQKEAKDVAVFYTDDLEIDMIAKLTTFAAGFLKTPGFVVNVSGTTIKVGRPKTTEELDELLASLQRDWDRQADAYDKFVQSGETKRPEYHYNISGYCTKRGIPVPWDTEA